MRTKKEKEAVRPNCRYCEYAGPVKNHICRCEVLHVGRATGVRACRSFKVNNKKYLEYAANNGKKN